MAANRGSALNALLKQAPKKHFCPTHGEECKAVKLMPGGRTAFNCPGKDGNGAHQLRKGTTVLK